MSASQGTYERSRYPGVGTVEPEQMLAEYRRRQLELAELIRGGMNLASDRGADHRAESARSLLTHLAEDRFQLAVIGQFSRGKSTLMNAILGRPYLPTGALPMTSVITRVDYGSRPRAMVHHRGGHGVPIDTPLGDLARFVAQSSAEREERQVVSADVRVPAEILRLGFSFVDTPGIGSAVAGNTSATRRFLSEADAVMFVTAFDSPLSEAELQFLAEAREHVDKLFYVVNKLDLVSAEEAREVIDFVRQRLPEDPDGSSVRVFAISARDALQAKLGGADEDLSQSGLAELERALVAFMTTEKARSFLLNVSARAERLLSRVRLDLEIGRAVSVPASAQINHRAAGFGERVEALIASERRVAERLGQRVASELPSLLAARARRWMDELRRILVAELDARWPTSEGAEMSSDSARDAVEHLNEGNRRRLDDWLSRRLGETQSLLVGLAATELDVLYAMRESVDALGAAVFGVPLRDCTNGATWSPADLPQLAARRVVLHIESPRSRRVGARARRDLEHRTRLLEAVDAALLTYAEDFRSELVRSSLQWSEMLASAVQDETRRSAQRLAANARSPGTAAQFATLAGLERGLTAFRAQTAKWQPSAASVSSALPELSAPARAEPVPRCVICKHLADVPFRFMTKAQWDLARKPDSRSEHIRAGGFCPMHTWQYAEIASELGMALAYAPLAQFASELIEQGKGDELAAALLKLLPGPERCPACVDLAHAEHVAVQELLRGLPARVDGSPPPSLCVPHLGKVLEAGPEAKTARWLSRRLAATLSRGAEDLRTYALKREAMRASMINDEEGAASAVVISHLAGSRGLIRPWRHHDEIG